VIVKNFTSLSPDFLSFCRDFGEPFAMDPTVYQKYYSKSINHITRYDVFNGLNSLGQRLDIEVGLVMNKKIPNAYCSFHEFKHYILIEHLFPIALMEFFHRLMANPAVLPGIGNTVLDTKLRRIDESNFLPGFEILGGARPITNLDDIEELYGALCPERRKAAMLLYEHAMTFLYAHELTHALLGHVLYMKQQLGIQAIREIHSNPTDELRRKINCYLEQQADNGAAWNTVGLNVCNPNDSRPRKDKIADATFRILASSLLLYFFALADLNYSNGDTNSIYQWYDHPSSAARAIYITIIPMLQIPDYNNSEETKTIIEYACLTARTELLRMAASYEFLRPYNWLRKSTLQGLWDESLKLSARQKMELVESLEVYAFKKGN
jgi:hypothetical protein